MKIKIIYLCMILFFTCTSDPVSYDIYSTELSQEDIFWSYDFEDRELLIQINTSNINPDLISSLKIKLIPFHDDFVDMSDNGEDGDLISNNKIYSRVVEKFVPDDYTWQIKLIADDNTEKLFEYDINFNSPSIVDSYIPSEHTLDESNFTFLDLIVIINDEDGNDDIEYVKYYIKKVDFNNGILLENGTCDYEPVQENDYIEDPSWIMDYIGTSNGNLAYRVEQLMNPLMYESGCGGFGEIQFKFEVKDKKGFSDILELNETTLILLP